MAFLFEGIAKAILYVIPPLLEVDIDTSDTDGHTIAGRLTKICTITIKFPDYSNFWQKDPRTEIDSLRPTVDLENSNSAHLPEDDVDLILGEDNWVSDEEVRFDIYLRVYLADTYVAHIKFSRSIVHFVGQKTVSYTVRPAEPRSIELIGKQPVQGQGEGESIYRGGKVRFFLKVKDDYGNIRKGNDLNFNMTQTTGSVTLISTQFDDWRRYHVVTVRCDQTGMASFRLSLPTTSLPRLQVMPVILPPVSAYKSFVPNLDEIQSIEHVAGIPFKVKLVLRDVFGNVVPSKEREESTKQVEIRIGNEVPITTKVSEVVQYSKECEIEIVPFVAGVRMMYLSIANENVKDFPIRCTVRPGEPRYIELIGKEPEQGHGEGDSIYRGGKVKFFLKVKDEHLNTCEGNDLNFNMTQTTGSVTLISTEFDDWRCYHVVTVRCDQTGMASFGLSLQTASLPHLQVKIIPPPVSAFKSFVPNLDEIQKVEYVAGIPFEVKLVLRDIFGNVVPCEEREESTKQIEIRIVKKEPIRRRRSPPRMIPTKFSTSKVGTRKCEKVPIRTKPISPTKCSTTKVSKLGQDSDECELEVVPYVAGVRMMYLSIANKNVKDFPIRCTVRPGEPRSIELIGKEPEQGHGEGDSIYRGGKVKFFLKVKDEHLNTCERNDLNFNMNQTTGSVTLVSTEFDDCRCHHVVIIRCDQTGMASFGLSLQTASLPHLQVKIISPPVSASKSFVPNLDEIQSIEHVAGIPFKVKLVLRDIFGNVVPCEEREESTKQVDIRLEDEVPIERKLISPTKFSTTKVSENGQNSNECELEVTPLTAGLRMMALSIADENLKGFPISITVVPGPLAEIKITSHDPFVPDNEIVSYPTEQRAAVAEGTDGYGNVVSLDPQTCYLEISGEALENPITIDGTTCRPDDSTLKFSYTLERMGTHNLTIKPKDASQTHIKVPSFVIQVTRPPIDLGKCEAKVCQEEPIFTGRFRPLQLQLLLYDCTNDKYEIRDDEIPHLKVEVDCRICQHTVRRGNQPNELFLVLDQIEEDGEKDIQVKYKDEDFCPLEAYVVDVIHYNEVEYIETSVVDAVPFDEEEYSEDEEIDQNIISCVGVSKRFILGEDYANINNIQRVLATNGHLSFRDPDLRDVVKEEAKYQVVFDLKSYNSTAVFSEVTKLLSLLLKGAYHYRGQARRFDKDREEWKAEATRQYHLGNHAKAKECRAIKEKFGELMNQSNKLASDAIFQFYNYDRPDWEIDLHGQLVIDEKQLEDYKKQLQRKKNTTRREVDGIIERERNEGDEAIRLLKERLTKLKNKETRPSEHDWLEIIDGAGHHSQEGQKLRPKVEKFLKKHKYEYTKANKGALLITFSEYTGKEPCYGNFYCKKCEKAWVSHTSWKGYYQQCYRCDSDGNKSECNPFKLRSYNSSWRRPHRRATSAIVFTDEDHVRLCQKCQVLGRDCTKI